MARLGLTAAECAADPLSDPLAIFVSAANSPLGMDFANSAKAQISQCEEELESVATLGITRGDEVAPPS